MCFVKATNNFEKIAIFKNMRDGFLPRCQNSLRQTTPWNDAFSAMKYLKFKINRPKSGWKFVENYLKKGLMNYTMKSCLLIMKKNYFENMTAGFLLRCQNTLRWNTLKRCIFRSDFFYFHPYCPSNSYCSHQM